MTLEELLAKQNEWLEREIKQHERDIMLNEGKVGELRELLSRNQNTCIHCGDYIYPSYDKAINRMAEHISSQPPEEVILEEMERHIADAVIEG